jgi:hypothetical protein
MSFGYGVQPGAGVCYLSDFFLYGADGVGHSLVEN